MRVTGVLSRHDIQQRRTCVMLLALPLPVLALVLSPCCCSFAHTQQIITGGAVTQPVLVQQAATAAAARNVTLLLRAMLTGSTMCWCTRTGWCRVHLTGRLRYGRQTRKVRKQEAEWERARRECERVIRRVRGGGTKECEGRNRVIKGDTSSWGRGV